MLSVILINFRMKEKLQNCIKSIIQTQNMNNIEIIVVNKPSGDGTEDFLHDNFPYLKLVNCKKFGIAHMRNLGIKQATGEYLLFLDIDTSILDDLTPALKYINDHPDTAALGVKLLSPSGKLQYSCRTFYDLKTIIFRRTLCGIIFPQSHIIKKHLMIDFSHNHTIAVDWIQGAFFLTTRRALQKIGSFDEFSPFGFEDVAWCYRAYKLGWKIYYFPELTVIHEYQKSSAKLLSIRAFHHFIAFISFLLKYKIFMPKKWK